MAQRAPDRSKGCGSHRPLMVRQADTTALSDAIPYEKMTGKLFKIRNNV
jgi:hypothetical protein